MYVIQLNWNPPTGNMIRKMEHWKYAKLRNEWTNRLKAYFMKHKTPLAFGKKIYICAERHPPTARLLDFHNLVWTFKPAFDALQEIGSLVDDSPEWLKDRYFQTPGTGITLHLTSDEAEFLEKVKALETESLP